MGTPGDSPSPAAHAPHRCGCGAAHSPARMSLWRWAWMIVLLGAVVMPRHGMADAWDPGDDTGAGATALTPTTTFQSHGPHTLSPTDTADWYQFNAIAGYTYTFNTIGGTGDDF